MQAVFSRLRLLVDRCYISWSKHCSEPMSSSCTSSSADAGWSTDAAQMRHCKCKFTCHALMLGRARNRYHHSLESTDKESRNATSAACHYAQIALQVGILPTDTYPALVCDLEAKAAVQKIYDIKQMSPSKQLSILCRSLTDIGTYTLGFPVSQIGRTATFKLARQVLPGPVSPLLPFFHCAQPPSGASQQQSRLMHACWLPAREKRCSIDCKLAFQEVSTSGHAAIH